MPAPDVVISFGAGASPQTFPTDTGQAFFVGQTQRGSIVKPSLCRSLSDFIAFFGARLLTSTMYDAVETFFAEGGVRLYVSRKYGAGAARATLNLLDGTSATALVGSAGQYGDSDPGTWANGAAGGLSASVTISGGTYQINHFLNSVLVETSPPLTTQADAVAWSNHPTIGSKYVSYALGGGTVPPAAAAAANFAGGTDGSALADADQQGALDRIPKILGPGQICAPGATTSTLQLQVIAHGIANNRYALLDGTDTSTAATLISQAAALYGAPGNGRRWGQLLAPWDIVPGLTSFSFRTVPPSARFAAQIARLDALGNPNQAAAGDNGIARFATDLSQPNFSDSDRKALNEAGVTISRRRFGGTIKTYGARTLADQTLDKDWSWGPNVRTIMAYVARVYAQGDAHQFKQIDGGGRELSAFKTDLTGPALDLLGVGALYGGSPNEAFLVDTGPGVNPPAQLANNIMGANVKLRTSPGAETISVNIVKTPITQSV